MRLEDNPALSFAARSGRPVIPLFVFDTAPPGRAVGAASRWWLDKSLASLARSLEARGSRLVLHRGDPAAILQAMIAGTGATLVAWNRSFAPAEAERDEGLAAELRGRGVETAVFNAALLLDPTQILTQSGGHYSVFTPFWRAARLRVGPFDLEPAPERLASPTAWPSSETLSDWGLHPQHPDWSSGFDRWTPGEPAATAQVMRMVEDALRDYPAARDRPGVEGSSRLSPHLAWGEIGPRQVYRAVEGSIAIEPGLGAQADKFLSELGWREFNYTVLAAHPDLARSNVKAAFDAFPWRRSAPDLRAWRRGRTGYPIVDAGMRQLWREGWMHNRVRLIAASFLVKHLLIDWREGERWFWDTLVDADPANNPANWQWVAGSGADAAPFFRIFNPVLQGEKFDADGAYVRRWAPELASLPDRFIHAPWTAPSEVLSMAGVELGVDYPAPIVEHGFARARALEALRGLRV